MPIFQELPMGLPGGANQPRDAVEHAHFKERVMMELHAPKKTQM